MDFSSRTVESPPIGAAVADVARLVRLWRSEVPGQWRPNELELNQERLSALLQEWRGGGGDPTLVLWVVLGTEWLYRARRATGDDVEAEIAEIRKALLKGSPNPNRAVFVERVAGPLLRRRLKDRRFLVALGTWTVPSADIVMELARAHHGQLERSKIEPRTAVRVKPGPIPNVGPIIAGVLIEGAAETVPGLRDQATHLAVELTRILLHREVSSGEFGKWRGYLSRRIPDPMPGLSEPERRTNLRDWLVFRFGRVFPATRGSMSWEEICGEAERSPHFLFSCVGDAGIAARVYAIYWG
jgi:hypothetical protein